MREFASNSLATVRGIDKLHSAWLAQRQDGKVPVVICDSYTEAPGAFGANYEPVFRIIKWIDRPADLQASPSAPSQPEPPAHVTDVPGEPESFDEYEAGDEF